MKIRSTGLYDPRTITSHTTAAPTGTVRYFEIPKIPMPLAIPANSAAMLPRSASPNTTMVKKVMRSPNSSRNEFREPLAGHGPHAGRHLLHHNQRDRGRDQRPEQGIAELGAGLRVGEDAPRIVVHVGRDEPGPHHREKGRQP